MPFRSESQRRLFHVMASRGEISPQKVKEWERETPKEVKKRLPYHVADRRKSESEKRSMYQAYADGVQLALYNAGLLKSACLLSTMGSLSHGSCIATRLP